MPFWVIYISPTEEHFCVVHNSPLEELFCLLRAFRNDVWHIHTSKLPINRCHFSPNTSWKTPIARPLGRGNGGFGEFEVWPKFYLRSCCALCIIVLYCTAIYRESKVFASVKGQLPLEAPVPWTMKNIAVGELVSKKVVDRFLVPISWAIFPQWYKFGGNLVLI